MGLISASRVRINGVVTDNPAAEVREGEDVVEVDGRQVHTKPLRYVLFHKPVGCVTTRNDPEGRPTIYSLLPPELHDLPYVGRLDLNSSGVQLLTNDGNLTWRLTRPEFRVRRVYLADVRGRLRASMEEKLTAGILDEGELLKAQEARTLRKDERGGQIEIVLVEGKYREVRRMLSALGLSVVKLARTEYAGLGLSGLEPGHWRELTPDERGRLEAGGRPATATLLRSSSYVRQAATATATKRRTRRLCK